MLERRRKNKHYDIVPGDDDGELDDGNGGERDVELGRVGEQETGVLSGDALQAGAGATNVSEELDNWDENAEDWEEEEPSTASGEGAKTPSTDDEPKKRND